MAGSQNTPTNSPSKRARRLVINASHVAAIHTYLALTAFAAALFLGCVLHYKKIVKNGVAAYPDEWFPSVSATYVISDFLSRTLTRACHSIGDWYPERNVFQILIALTSGQLDTSTGVAIFMMVISRSTLHPCIFAVFPRTIPKHQLARFLVCCGHYSHTHMRGLGVHHVQR
jgi:hypothetical protein